MKFSLAAVVAAIAFSASAQGQLVFSSPHARHSRPKHTRCHAQSLIEGVFSLQLYVLINTCFDAMQPRRSRPRSLLSRRSSAASSTVAVSRPAPLSSPTLA
jgi:hypothetical protein